MDLLLLFTPLSISVTAILGIFFLLQLAVDTRRSSEVRMLRRSQKLSSAPQDGHTISVVIELSKKAATIVPLLDHLASHGYINLQVVVVVKHTAGKNAAPALRQYQRAHKALKIRIVTHRKGMNSHVIAKRFTNGELLMPLTYSDRLSDDFFKMVSARFTEDTIDGLQVRHHVPLDMHIRRALAAWSAIQHDMVMNVMNRHHYANVYRRKKYCSGDVTKIGYSSIAAISNETMTGQNSFLIEATFFGLVLFAVVLSVLIVPSDAPYILITPLLGMLLLMSNQLAATRGYKPSDRLNLFLLLPFEPFFAAARGLGKLFWLVRGARLTSSLVHFSPVKPM